MATYDPANEPEKMWALVQLAASIADQLAKIARSLAAEAELLTQVDAGQNLQIVTALIKRNAKRTSEIVNELLTFAGRQSTAPQILRVAAVLSELTPLMRCLAGSAITLNVSCADNVGSIFADRFQFENLMCILVTRARTAMPDGGTIEIRAENLVQLEWRDLREYLVSLRIADTGRGIASPLLPKLFEPVLSRKYYGVWLGLSNSLRDDHSNAWRNHSYIRLCRRHHVHDQVADCSAG